MKGTVTNFANQQSASDSGAYSTLAERIVQDANIANHLVISEFTTRGPGGIADEFIELYNPTSSAVNITGWKIYYYSTTWGVLSGFSAGFPAGSSVPAYGFWLVANMQAGTGYVVPTSGPTPNWNVNSSGWFTDMPAGAPRAFRLQDASANVIDTVGVEGNGNTAYAQAEGGWSAPAPDPSSPYSSSTERKSGPTHSDSMGNGYDTNNNYNDLYRRTTRQAQNTASALEYPFTCDMEIYENITSVPSADNHTLQLRYELANANDTFNVQVWNGSAWNNRGSTLNSTSWTDWSYKLDGSEVISGTVQVRFVDVNTSSAPQDSILKDYLRVMNETAPIQYKLTMATNAGSTTPAAGITWYDSGTVVNISATPPSAGDNENYIFNGWTGTGTGCYNGPNQSAQVTMNDNITETASWTHRYKLTMATNFGDTSPTAGDHWYDAGTVVNISAPTPSAGAGEQYVWDNWTGTGTGSYTGTTNSTTVTMNSAITETALWTHQYKLTMATNFGTTDPAVGDTWENAGTVVNISATGPGGGYVWNGWTGTGTISYTGTDNPASVTMSSAITETALWTYHILIVGNDNFTLANGVTSGSGTVGDPYIIENYIIDASTANGIEIRNTTAYFVVRNCVVKNGWINYYGIKLDNVVKGRIENNTCSNNGRGIYLSSSSYDSLTGNTCSNNSSCGIYLYSSSYDNLTGNTCENNTYGVYLYSSCNYDNLTGNTCENNTYGIYLYPYSSYANLTANTCSNNYYDGIYLRNSAYANLTNNTCENNFQDGIYLQFFCSYDNLTGNTCSNNARGIYLLGADNNITLTNNTCENNSQYGIYLSGSSYDSLTGNTCSNNICGIYLYSESNYNNLTGNTCSNNTYGVYLYSACNYDNLTNNTCENNARGIYLSYSSNKNLIFHNTIISNGSGIHIEADVNADNVSVNFNNIVGNENYGIYNGGSGTLNAKFNWWGDASGPGGSGPGTGDNINENVLYSPWLGFTVGTVPMTFHVDNTGTIQSAIDAASSGDTVIVHDGTYRENLFIDKSITLKSASKPILEAPDTIALRSYTGPSGTQNFRPIIEVYNTTGVTIDGFIIDGRGVGNANSGFVGIHFFEASGTISNNEVKRVRNTPLDGAQYGNAILVNHLWDQYYAQSVTIENNLVYEYQKNGITCNEIGTVATVENNTVMGAGPTLANGQNGIQIARGATGTVIGNAVSGNSYTGSTWASAGILVMDNSVDVLANEVDNNYIGIYYSNASGNISGNIVNASAAGTGRTDFSGILIFPNNDVVATYTNSVTNNILTGDDSGDSIGIYIYTYSSLIVNYIGTRNNVTDWGYGYVLFQEDSSTLNVTENFSNITSNVNYGMYTDKSGASPVNAVYNWWGDESGPNNPTTNPSGLGDAVSDGVAYVAWLRAPVGLVWVGISPSSQSGANGTPLSYTVTVQNTDDSTHTFDLDNSDNAIPSWEPSLSTSSLTIPAGENRTATLSVTVPLDAVGGTVDNMTVTATSQDNAAVTASASCTATVNISRSVSVSISPPSQSGGNGATLTYTVTVTNTGNVADTYTLDNTDTLGWVKSLSNTSVGPLAPFGGSDNTTILSVTLPSTGTDNVTVTATGTGDNASASCTATVALVYNVNKGTWYQTIQAAVNAADNGNTILVYPGIFHENVLIQKSITLTGTDKNAVIIDGTGLSQAGITNSGTWGTVTWENLVISNLTIRGFNLGVGCAISLAHVGNVTMENLIIENCESGIVLFGSSDNNIIRNNIIDNCIGNGIAINGSNSPPGAKYNVIENNTITNCGTGYGGGPAICAFSWASWNTIENNTIIGGGTGQGITLWGMTATFAIETPENNNTIVNNTISNFNKGIYIYGAGITNNNLVENTTIVGNTLTSDNYGVDVYGFTDNVIGGVHFNSIVGNQLYGIRNRGSATVDATCNWWGDASGPYNPTTNPSGLGDNVSDNVTYAGWARAPIGTVWIDVLPSDNSGANLVTLNYTVTVQNPDNVTHTFDLTDNAEPGWLPNLSPTSLTIAPNEDNTATFSVTVPSGLLAGTVYNMTITATSQDNGSISASASCTATVTVTRSVSVSISPSSQSGVWGTTLTYTVTVTNTGNVSDTYTLDNTDTNGWTTMSLSNTSVVVPAFSSDNTTILSVTIPVGGADDNITVTATGTGVSENATCTAQVVPGLVHNVTKDLWYTTIQAAVNAADNGNTILVYPGIFHENVLIQKSITLTGTDKNAVIIDGTGLSQAGITNSGTWGTVTWENLVISNLTIRGFNLGVGCAISLAHVGNVTMENLIFENDDSGIVLFGSCDNDIVRNNVFENCPGNAIAINGSNSSPGAKYNVIEGNTITNCGTGYTPTGVSVICVFSWASWNTIENNTLIGTSNLGTGIALWGTTANGAIDTPENNNTIVNNTISGLYNGIRIVGNSARLQNLVENTTIVRNTLTSNTYGVYIKGFTDNVIGSAHFNNIVGNQIYGIYDNSSATLNATCNWYGDASGPYNPTTNPSGLGDNVSDNVTYAGWARAPIGTVWVGISPTNNSGANGTTLNYTVTVQNTDDVSHTFDLTDNAGPSWLPNLSSSSLTIAPNENSTATFSVTVPSNAIGGTIYNMTITATSQDNGSISASASCTAESTGVIFSLNLATPWNLVCFPIDNGPTTPNRIFTGLTYFTDYYIYAWTAPSGPYVLVGPDDVLQDNVGYWVYTTSDQTLTWIGTQPTSRNVYLVTGWNTAGFPINNENTTPNNKFEPLSYFENYYIYYWNAPGGSYSIQDANTAFKDNTGYWVWIDQNKTVTVP